LFFQKLTEQYFETKFAKINVDKAKFLVEKLKIRVLPAVLCFKKGIVVDRYYFNLTKYNSVQFKPAFSCLLISRMLLFFFVVACLFHEVKRKKESLKNV
jgi:hypothetical protein